MKSDIVVTNGERQRNLRTVIKPGKWWIVRVRKIETYDQIAHRLAIDNSYTAGNRGDNRKWTMKRVKGSSKRQRVYRRRRWSLYSDRYAYKFSELIDAQQSSRCAAIYDWLHTPGGFVEIVEVKGCLYYGTIVSEQVIDRRFSKDANAMLVIAIESTMTQNPSINQVSRG